MINTNILGYSYNDLTIIPSIISKIKSRSECNCFNDVSMLPIFTAPMASVVNIENAKVFESNYIYPIIPRNIPIVQRMLSLHSNNNYWVALSLNEFKSFFIDDKRVEEYIGVYHICVDIANGHMEYLYELCKEAKLISNKHSYKLVIMTGNIANPETYKWICEFNRLCGDSIIDYIRVGIGGGSGCFIDGTKIKTINGEKNIEDINDGELVLTIDGSYQRVINTTRFKSNELVKINNEVTSTINHKFFVINKEDKNKVNENNLQKYGYWLEANKLDKEKHLLIKIS